MPIPDYQTIMLPLLQLLSSGKEHRLTDAAKAMADHFNLTETERKEHIPSGKSPLIQNRTGWARTYLKKAGLVKSIQRGTFKITPRGLEVLAKNPSRIDVRFLEQFPEFVEFKHTRHEKEELTDVIHVSKETPEEGLESAYEKLRSNIEVELLESVKSSSPEFLERLVVELLVKMGYGGSLRDAGQAIGQSGDGGIDGIIKEDRLGLDVIYVQAKRWENTVGRPEIQKFAGALQGHRAKKGVFLTTAQFSKEAWEYSRLIDNKIVLIDGEQLANLMIDHNVGVSPVISYEIERIDSDYFAEDNI